MVSHKEKVTAKNVDYKNVELEQVYYFKYLGVTPTPSEYGGSEEVVKVRINAAWLKQKELTSVIYDKCMSRKLKVKLYETVIWTVLLNGAEL